VDIKRVAGAFVSLFFPADCRICAQFLEPLNRTFICEDCWNKVKWLRPPYCSKCSKPLSLPEISQGLPSLVCLECQKNHPHFKKVFVPTLYEGVIREAIHLLKYEGKVGVLRGIKRVMEIYFTHNHLLFSRFDLVVPVPLHRRRLRERGFNQAELLARIIARYFNLKLVKDNLKKIRSTRSQTELNKEERRKNVKGAFKVKDKIPFRDKAVLLVDDVYTTGATVGEIAKVLKRAGAKEIYVFTLARAC